MQGNPILVRPMKLRVLILALSGLMVLAPSARSQSSAMGEIHATRIAEAYRLLAHVQSQDDWAWAGVPFSVLLLTQEKDFLVGHPAPTSDFTSEGVDPLIGIEVFSRPPAMAFSE